MTQTNEGQPRDIANPASSSPPSDSEDSHQFPPSPPGIHDNQQFPPPVFALAPSPSQSPEAGEMITLSPQPPVTTQAEVTPSLPQRPLDVDVDPRIASLRAMFPDFDDSLLSSVLQSVNGDQDLAIDTLLGMSDPDYVSQPLPPPEQRESAQTDLDEQLARRLMLEEEQAAQNQWRPPQQEQGPQYYQSRRSASRDRAGGDETGRYTSTAQAVAPPQRDTMAEFQDGFNKIAETGKKTFSSIVSKVKAKIQEYDQGQGTSRQDTQPTWGQSSQPSWGGGQPTQPQYQSSYHDPNLQHQESYYDPNPPVDNGVRGSGWQSPRPGGGNSNPRTNSVPTLAPSATYAPPNFATKPIPDSTSVASNSPTYAGPSTYSPPTTSMGTSPPPELARRSGDTPRPPSTGVGTQGGIDVTKFGLLPKRPVSLLREQPPPTHRDDSDDELEYTENPFEERR